MRAAFDTFCQKAALAYLRIYGPKNMHELRYFFGSRESTIRNIEEMRDRGAVKFIPNTHPAKVVAA